MAVVDLLRPEDAERRRIFATLKQDEAQALADVEEHARRVVRAERQQWAAWLKRDALNALAMAHNRLDVARARLAALQEGSRT